MDFMYKLVASLFIYFLLKVELHNDSKIGEYCIRFGFTVILCDTHELKSL